MKQIFSKEKYLRREDVLKLDLAVWMRMGSVAG